MTGPANINPRSIVRDLDTMMTAGGVGWEALETMFQPAVMADPWRPSENVMKFAAAMAQTDQGREFLAFIFDLTKRAPYPHIGNSMESAALAAAKHEARAAVGEVVLQAIVEGRKLLES